MRLEALRRQLTRIGKRGKNERVGVVWVEVCGILER